MGLVSIFIGDLANMLFLSWLGDEAIEIFKAMLSRGSGEHAPIKELLSPDFARWLE